MTKLSPKAIRPKTLLITAAVMLMTIQGASLSAFADEPVVCVPPSNSTQAGVIRPVGADAALYVYNCDSGLWENDHYSFNPGTGIVTAKDIPIYTYDTASKSYTYTTWVYNAPTHTYVPYTQSVVNPPAGATVIGAPLPAVTNTSIENTGPNSSNSIDANSGSSSGAITNTGPDSNNQLGANSGANSAINNQSTALLNNILTSTANSGNSAVIMNTNAGNATTGDASALANVVNLLQSSSNALGGDTVTFVANIDGDVNGDLMIDPSQLGAIQPATASPSGSSNLILNNSANAAINNTISLDATSGNAMVGSNTSAGDASTGSARAIANVVNVINSALSSGQSFLGVININGNFNGDILVPPDFIDQLIAANVPTVSISMTGPNSNNSMSSGQNGMNTTVNNTNNQGINNNVNATAYSGTATVTNNTSAGNATTGTASTNITAFNLTGSSVIGKNALLVFVNVLGTWVGMIVNAPQGATAAELGGGITSMNTNGGYAKADITNSANQQINNTINARAVTGNAAVDSNTKAGNATTGNAQTAVNLLNVENSSLSLANWFGILFINVFGTWNGSFGMNTSAGDPLSYPSTATTEAQKTSVLAAVRVFSFAPHTTASQNAYTPVDDSSSAAPAAVLAAHVAKVVRHTPDSNAAASGKNLLLPIMGVMLFVAYVIGERIYAYQTKR